MNANEISPKASARLKRIQMVSGLFRAVFLVVTLLSAMSALTKICLGLSFSQAHTAGFALWTVISLTNTVGAWFVYKLFQLYSNGDLFTLKVVHCMRTIGYLCILGGVEASLAAMFPAFGHQTNPNFVAGISVLPVCTLLGLLFIFISWIIDEGRKIQEEQELTV